MLNNRGYITPLITVFIAMITITAVVYFTYSERVMAKSIHRDSSSIHEILELEEKKGAMQGFALFCGYQAAYDTAMDGGNGNDLRDRIEKNLNEFNKNFDYQRIWNVNSDGNKFSIQVERGYDGDGNEIGFIIRSTNAPKISDSGEIAADSELGIDKLVDARFFLLYDIAKDFGEGGEYRKELVSNLRDNVESQMSRLDDIESIEKSQISGDNVIMEWVARTNGPVDVNSGDTAIEIFRNSFIGLEKDIISSGDFSKIIDRECGIAIKPRSMEVAVSKNCNLNQDCYDECYGECTSNGCDGYEEANTEDCEYEVCEEYVECWTECDEHDCWTECEEYVECWNECDMNCVKDECDSYCSRKCNWVTWRWSVDTDMNVSLIDYSAIRSTGDENFMITVNRPIILKSSESSPLEYRVDRLMEKSGQELEFHYDIAIEYAEDFSCENHAGIDPEDSKSYNLPPYYQIVM